MDALTQALLERPEAADAWSRFAGLPCRRRETIVDELKAELDQRCRSNPSAALDVAATLTRAAEGLPSRSAIALRGSANANHANGRFDEALGFYTLAERLYRDAGEELEAARVLRSIVDVHQMSGRSAEALDCAERAAEVFKAHGEERLLAQLEVNVGNVHFRLDDYPRAHAAYVSARDRFKALADKIGLAFTEYNLANVETNDGRFVDAERSYRSALAVFEEIGMAVHVADCHYSIAYLDSRRGRFASAVEGLEAARKLYEGDSKPSGAPLCDLDLAEIYLRLDARRDALEHARRATERFHELGFDYECAKTRGLMGLAELRLGDREAALADLERAAESFRELGNEVLEASLVIQSCAAFASPEEARSALPRLREACTSLVQGGHRLLADLGAVALARTSIAAGEARAALGILAPLVDAASERAGLDRLVLAGALRATADAHVALHEPAPATEALRRAVDVVDATYAQVPGTDVRIAFFREHHEAFVDLAWLLVEHADDSDAEALALLERSRMRSTEESPAHRATPEDTQFQRARERLDWLLCRRLEAELGAFGGDHEEARHVPSDEELLASERDLAARVRARTSDPGASEVRLDGLDWRGALAEDEVLVAWMTTRAGACAFVIDSKGVRVERLELEPERLSVLRDELTFQLQKFQLGSAYLERHHARLLASTQRVLDDLGRLLLGPVADDVRGRSVICVPYGELHGLPFHAFRLDGEYLIEASEVSYARSVRSLVRARKSTAAPCREVLATGTSDASAPAIERELDHLGDLYGERLTRLASEDVAALLRTGGGGTGILHIAAHGRFQPQNPVFSGVRLGEAFLTAHDLRRSRLDFGLVTLSGCETGRQMHVAGEEHFGPEQALFTAGVRTVVSSLWTLSDLDSADFMGRFYDHLAAGHAARHALTLAQRQLLRERPHPFSWAPFLLAGDPDVRCPSV